MTFNSRYKSAIDLKSCFYKLIIISYLPPTLLSGWQARLCTRVGWLWSTGWVEMILQTTQQQLRQFLQTKCPLTWGRFVERQQRSVLTEMINVETCRGKFWWNSKLDTFCCCHPMVYHWHLLLPRYVGQNHIQDSL